MFFPERGETKLDLVRSDVAVADGGFACAGEPRYPHPTGASSHVPGTDPGT
jgi:hypothetical protein